jgi:hypothetical protein
VQPHRGGSAIDLSAIASWCACLVGPPWSIVVKAHAKLEFAHAAC